MKDSEQAKEFIETSLSRLEQSVLQKKDTEIFQAKQEFNSLISEYGKIIGKKSIKNYFNNYSGIMEKGKYLKWQNSRDPTEEKKMN